MLKVGIQWEMERRKNIASFITLVVFYVSLVKINSRKLEARASCSLEKHVHPVEGNSGFPFRGYSESVFYLIAGEKPVCFLLKCQYVPVYMLLSSFVTCKLMSNDFKLLLRKLVLRKRSSVISLQMPLGLILSYI